MKKTLTLFHPFLWPAWFAIGILWSITRLPMRRQYQIGRLIGRILYYIPSKIKHITETNIKLCFPNFSQEERDQFIKKNFESLGMGIIESASAWWTTPTRSQCRLTIHGEEHVKSAYAKGKGVILVSPHFTCLEKIGGLIQDKYPFAIMYRPHKKKLIAFLHEHFRQKNIHYIARQQMRETIRTLNKNMAIWYAYDVDAGKKRSVFAPFFNISTASLTSVSRLAKMTGAAVVPISFYRCDDESSYEIILSPPLKNFPSDDLVADATRLNQTLEKGILKKPEQYIWQYKRFKTRPAKEKRFY